MGNERDPESEEEDCALDRYPCAFFVLFSPLTLGAVEIRKLEEQLQKLAPQELEPTGEMFQRPLTKEGTAPSPPSFFCGAHTRAGRAGCLLPAAADE